jgi:hypothetical protein
MNTLNASHQMTFLLELLCRVKPKACAFLTLGFTKHKDTLQFFSCSHDISNNKTPTMVGIALFKMPPPPQECKKIYAK